MDCGNENTLNLGMCGLFPLNKLYLFLVCYMMFALRH
jgi:hypothetical protein